MTLTRSHLHGVWICALLAATASAQTARSPRFDVQAADPVWTAEAQGVLARTGEAFHDAFTKAGFVLRPTDEALTCRGFAHRAAFERYARHADGIDMSWSDGYYSARTNRIALYFGPSTPLTERDARHADSATHHVDGHGDWAMKLAHEAAHQLAFNSGLQKRGVMYPLWATEGMATWFESCAGNRLALDADNPDRRADLTDMISRGALMPLTELLTTTRVPAKAEAISDVYAQSWAWFRFAITQEPEALQRYFAATASLPVGRRHRDILQREVEAAFGPLAHLEARWQRYVMELTGSHTP